MNAPRNILPCCLFFPAIDVVVGGAPCTDFSKVNATRKGTEGEQGKYIVSFGKLVRRIQEAQPDHHLFFLSENVVLDNNNGSNETGQGNLATTLDAFGALDSVVLDSALYSPVRRKRMYISNIPIDTTAASSYWNVCHDSSCLDDGYKHGALFEFPRLRIRYNTFMASQCRVDDCRMRVFKKVEGTRDTFEYRTLLVSEREAMMGFSIGYTEIPGMCATALSLPTNPECISQLTFSSVKSLFEELTNKGYCNTSRDGIYWKSKLPEPYHTFGGGPYIMRLVDDSVALALAPPTTAGKQVC
jgi:C-5 cytosine-specific DNA methylase